MLCLEKNQSKTVVTYLQPIALQFALLHGNLILTVISIKTPNMKRSEIQNQSITTNISKCLS